MPVKKYIRNSMAANYPRCVYCNGESDFIVKLRNPFEGVVGTLNVCEGCRHLIETTAPFRFQYRALSKFTDKFRLSDVPPSIESLKEN